MGKENELVDRIIASAIVSVCTRYVVEVERELLQLRIQIAEKGSALGNLELLGSVEERLGKVHDRMNGVSGEMLRLMVDLKKEFARIVLGSGMGKEKTETKRGRPAKTKDA